MVTGNRYRSRRFVLRKPRAREELAAAARLRSWERVGEQPAAPGKLYVSIWETAVPGVCVWYFEQDDPELCAVAVDSALGAEPIGDVATLIQGTLVPWMLTELLAEIDDAADRAFALRRAGFGAPQDADPEFLSRFSAAATDPDPDVRTAAIWAMVQTGWPECRPVVEEMSRADGSRAVRGLARGALRVLAPRRPAGGPTPVSVADLFPEGGEHLYPVAMKTLAEVADGSPGRPAS